MRFKTLVIRFALTAFGVILSATSARAASVFTYTSQTREVLAFAGVNGVGPNKEFAFATDFSPFHGDAVGTIGTAPVVSTVESIQDSTLGTNAMSLSSTMTVAGGAGTAGAGDSIFNVSFSVASNTAFTLSGHANGPLPSQTGTASVDITLADAGGNNVFAPLDVSLANDPVPLSESGNLAPATYTLNIHESLSMTASPGDAAMNLSFVGVSAVPLPSLSGGCIMLVAVAAASRFRRRVASSVR